MGEILSLCGNDDTATIASLKIFDQNIEGKEERLKDELRPLPVISLILVYNFL